MNITNANMFGFNNELKNVINSYISIRNVVIRRKKTHNPSQPPTTHAYGLLMGIDL